MGYRLPSHCFHDVLFSPDRKWGCSLCSEDIYGGVAVSEILQDHLWLTSPPQSSPPPTQTSFDLVRSFQTLFCCLKWCSYKLCSRWGHVFFSVSLLQRPFVLLFLFSLQQDFSPGPLMTQESLERPQGFGRILHSKTAPSWSSHTPLICLLPGCTSEGSAATQRISCICRSLLLYLKPSKLFFKVFLLFKVLKQSRGQDAVVTLF